MSPETIIEIKALTPSLLKNYTNRDNTIASWQFVNTLIPYLILFYISIYCLDKYWYVSVFSSLALSFFIVRVFMLMHDCGHRCMFASERWNAIGGFVAGVIVGMPEYVWSQHHAYHHQTNGNWEKYRGPLNILTVAQFQKYSYWQQWRYQYGRSIYLAPVGAFMYFIFNPRVNWMVGSLRFAWLVLLKKIKNPEISWKLAASQQPGQGWATWREYRHMTLNNLVLLSLWYTASMYFGALNFFGIYVLSLSLAGAMGIIIFTIQHNFEDSYAADSNRWDYYSGALKGTSYLTFPRILDWFGLDISYHHIHHLSHRIPNYRLAQCHRDHAKYFVDIPRIRLRDVPKSFKFILWDESEQKIVSIDRIKRSNRF